MKDKIKEIKKKIIKIENEQKQKEALEKQNLFNEKSIEDLKLEIKALSGDSEAQFQYAKTFSTQDASGYEETLKWLEIASANGHKEAKNLIPKTQFEYAKTFSTKDASGYEETLKWLEKASSNGHKEAKNLIPKTQFEYAKTFSTKDASGYRESLKWLEKASSNGYKEAESLKKDLENQLFHIRLVNCTGTDCVIIQILCGTLGSKDYHIVMGFSNGGHILSSISKGAFISLNKNTCRTDDSGNFCVRVEYSYPDNYIRNKMITKTKDFSVPFSSDNEDKPMICDLVRGE